MNTAPDDNGTGPAPAHDPASRHARRMRAVAGAAANVILAGSPAALREVLRHAVEGVIAFDAFLFAIYLPDEHALQYVDAWDLGVHGPAGAYPLAGTPGERVLRERRSMLTLRSDDPRSSGSHVIGTMRRSESIIRTPIVAGDDVLGLLSVQSYEQEVYGAEDVELLEVLASLAASSVQQLRASESRRLAEQALREREELLRSTFAAAAVGLVTADLTGRPLTANRAAEQILGYTAAELATLTVPEITHPEDLDLDAGLFGELLRGERSAYQVEKRFIRKDGSEVWARLSASLVFGDDAQPRYATGVLEDITQRRVAEAALQRSEELFRTVTEGMSDIVSVFDRNGIGTYHSPAYARVVGIAGEERLGRSALDRIHPDDHAAVVAAMHEVRGRRHGTVALRLRLRHADGSEIVLDTRLVNMLHNPTVAGVLAVSRDITAQARAEQALRESEERFRQLAETVREVFWLSDPRDRRVLYVSPAFADVFGMPVDALLADPFAWRALVHPDDRGLVEAALPRQVLGTFDEEFRIVRPDGETRWVSAKAFPIRDEEGVVYRVAGVVEDISQRRQAEEALHQARKMEAVSQLAGGIAHEFNNLFAAIGSHADFLGDGLAAGDAREHDIGEIRRATDRGSVLTRQLLTFARREIVQPRDFEPRPLIEQLRPVLDAAAAGCMLSFDLTARASITVDPMQLEQVMLTLVRNAREACEGSGAVTIECRDVLLSEPVQDFHGPFAPGRYVLIAVSDTGSGMDEQTRRRIFEPFFTTKPEGRGVGLGLASVHGIVMEAGGMVHVATEPGAGTTFSLYFPAAAPVAAGGAPVDVQAARATIVVVDDEPSVRSIVTRLLRRAGHDAIAASGAAEALEICRSRGCSVDVVITDIVMPDMGGRELAEQLGRACPHVSVIFMSGYTADEILRTGARARDIAFVEKPFTSEALLEAVREALSSRGR